MKFIFTCGDINGIGPEIAVKAINAIQVENHTKIYFLCPDNVVSETFKFVTPTFNFEVVKSFEQASEDFHKVSIIEFTKAAVSYGKPTPISGKTSIKALKIATDLALERKVDGIITAPVSKVAMKMAKNKYPGQTETLAAWSKTKNYAMLFVSKRMKAGLVTIHVPLKDVPKLITKNLVQQRLEALIYSMQTDFGFKTPKIALLGLNPHAGENGQFGGEEKKVLEPIVTKNKSMLHGPFPTDAFFAKRKYNDFDLILGMYHDQVLTPFKLLNHEGGVNYTAGLPFVRTSPDHGVAFDIAGKGKADERSALEAFQWAQQIAKNRYLYKIENGK